MLKNYRFIFVFVLLALAALSFSILSWGAVEIPFSEVLNILTGGSDPDKAFYTIMWELRLPRVFISIIAGASLGISGLLMQTYFQNPLAGPFVLGIHSGSSLAVALWVMGGAALGITLPESLGVGGAAFFSILGGAAVFGLLIFASFKVKGNVILLVVGLLFGYFTSGLISILITVTDAQKIKTFLMWSLGSFQGKNSNELLMLAVALAISFLWAIALSKRLNALLLGENYARSLGVNFTRLKLETLTLTAILSGSVTAVCGPVAFVGIMAPHIARKIFSSQNHFVLIPGTLLIGATLASFAELISGLGTSIVLPINAILGLMGAPFILFFILGKKRGMNA